MINMKPILDFILFFSLLSITTYQQFLLADTNPINIQHPNSISVGNESDYEALLDIKAKIHSDPNSVLSSWNNNSLHFCQWRGVICGHRHERVVGLSLPSSKLIGTLSPFIGNLSFLHVLDMHNNFFQGGIPHQISYLQRLRKLALGTNSFEGEIPANLSRCLHLALLELSNNSLVGRIPTEVASLPNMVDLRLYRNKLSGRLKDIGIGNMSSSLKTLYLHSNQLQGSIPDDVGRLQGLAHLTLGDNILFGIIPPSLFNISTLVELDFSNNRINGSLPQDLGLHLPQLERLYMGQNSLIGKVPASLSNLSHLIDLEMPYNSFEGNFSLNGNNLPQLSFLYIDFAFSIGRGTRDLGFLDTLTNCTNLMHLVIAGNSYTGTLPRSILNLSISLNILDLGNNQISGHLPFGLGKFVNLYLFTLQDNHFTGPIPSDIGKLKRIVLLYFFNYNFWGEIPSSLGNLTFLSVLSMEVNNLEGPLPTSIGNCMNLQKISLHLNKLSGVLPVELFHAHNLIYIEIGQNNFQGSIPDEISMLKNLVEFDVSKNRFSGVIPSTLGGCTSLTILNFSRNSFVGPIPNSLSPLKSIQTIDLSFNNLSGQIPIYFSSWPYLLSLNLSFNNLEGEVPTNGVFANTSVMSVVGNNELCGGVFQLHLRKCPSPEESKRRRLPLALILIISIACALILVLSVLLCFYLLCSSRKRKDTSLGLENIKPFLEVSYQMLLRATNGFSPSNLVGVGGFGSVYKGILHQDDTETEVAVKVLNLQNQGASKSFIAECNALRNIRHRNLVKIITTCSSIDTQRNEFKALVYEYMPRGNLESWVHANLMSIEQGGDNQSCILSLFQRLNIAIDVASALEYLHLGCSIPIIHCDLKPTNILLDDDMTAHVGDFGLAKFHSGASTSNIMNQSTSTQVRGTVGYVAPEYGLGSKVSLEGDIYSFGIIVLEMMTSMKPTDPMFKEGLNLHDFSRLALPDRVMDIIDQRMLGDDVNVFPARTGGDMRKIECIKTLLMVGVKCSMALPQERMTINDALNELKSAKNNIHSRGPRSHITIQC